MFVCFYLFNPLVTGKTREISILIRPKILGECLIQKKIKQVQEPNNDMNIAIFSIIIHRKLFWRFLAA